MSAQLDLLTNEVEAAFADGRLYLSIDPPTDGARMGAYIGCRFDDEDVVVVHVISKPQGGEIRGYALTTDGALRVRTPSYVGRWDELDAAVLSRVAGAKSVAPYGADLNGVFDVAKWPGRSEVKP